jgi:ABC-2 type transport system ATP-binding protein
MIRAQTLVKQYRDTLAVDRVTFDVNAGEIFGFLGPNGAGKTTTIQILTTLLRPTSGTATIDGLDIGTQRRAVRRRIGLVFQESSLDEQLTGWENLRFHARLYGMPRSAFQERASELLSLVELKDRANERVEVYSGGMKRRLEVVRGLLHGPKVLFLDEPTLGLDPQTRLHIWDYLSRLSAAHGITIFMTTHYMEEAEHCDRVAVIDYGKIVALDTPAALKGLVGGDVVWIETSNAAAAAKLLTEQLSLSARVGPDEQVIVEVPEAEHVLPRLLSTLTNGSDGIDVAGVRLRRPTLEDVFIKLTGRAMRDDELAVASGPRRQRRRRI